MGDMAVLEAWCLPCISGVVAVAAMVAHIVVRGRWYWACAAEVGAPALVEHIVGFGVFVVAAACVAAAAVGLPGVVVGTATVVAAVVVVVVADESVVDAEWVESAVVVGVAAVVVVVSAAWCLPNTSVGAVYAVVVGIVLVVVAVGVVGAAFPIVAPMQSSMAAAPVARWYLHLEATKNPHCIWMSASVDGRILQHCYPRIVRMWW